ncbi:MAG: CehA/McbA family metallohydrolase, partial [Planctomycetaceae bacterium]|nr:CehA/McbA family metallohydrolase [Planctomycetaceae bacterium]
MPGRGYWSGDPHLHFPRGSDAEDRTIFDLLDAEDIRYGVVMCYNETDRYAGTMQQLVMPQLRGVGRRSRAQRGAREIISGQEYRNQVYGHLNLFLRDDLVAPGGSYDPNRWPVFGVVGAETQQLGGIAIHAHGGYAQEIYADLVQRATNGVELLQFGIYRGIGLENWYRVLNCGFRFPAVGASDYPACRKLGDCLTYVEHRGEPTIEQWLAGAAAGRSFVTTGPMLLLEVEGQTPGATLEFAAGPPRQVQVKVRARADVTPVTHLQIIVGGQVHSERQVARERGQGEWLELSATVEIERSTWIAARAFSSTVTGSPDAEAHTNPVYVYCAGRAPYDEAALDWLAGVLDAQIAEQSQRSIDERERVVEYFRKSRGILEEIRRQAGLPASSHLRAAVERSLHERWLPPRKPLEEVKAFVTPRVAELPKFAEAGAWESYASNLRNRILDEIVFRGAAAEWRAGKVNFEWLDTIEGFADYRIRKLRYEALPGMWIPALLYEPLQTEGRVPVVLNVNGHDPEGKASKDEQIRSINCARRGMLALHPEWFGMGQLRTPGFAHGKMNQLDLCGASGLAPFYLALARGLDVLGTLPQADPDRVAVTGLSGGGWQTAWISALDERVTLANPVAGYTGLRTA